MSFSLSISTTPLHIVLWHDGSKEQAVPSVNWANSTYTIVPPSSEPTVQQMSESEEMKQLRLQVSQLTDKIQQLEGIIQDMQKEEKKSMIARPSPYFTATHVDAPIGLEILTQSTVEPSHVAFRKVVETVASTMEQPKEDKKEGSSILDILNEIRKEREHAASYMGVKEKEEVEEQEDFLIQHQQVQEEPAVRE
jgi:hypothetical protein